MFKKNLNFQIKYLFNKNKQLKKDQLKKTYLFKRAITVFNRTTQNAKEAQNLADD